MKEDGGMMDVHYSEVRSCSIDYGKFDNLIGFSVKPCSCEL